MKILGNTWVMLAAICLTMTLLSWQANGQAVVAYCIDNSVPEDIADEVRWGFVKWETHRAFTTVELCDNGPDTISVEWAPIPGNPIGLAYGRLYGYPQNRIVLDSTYNNWWSGWGYLPVRAVMHEAGHILLGYNHSRDRWSIMYFSAWLDGIPMLSWSDILNLVEQYGRARPMPQNQAGAYRP